MGDFSSFGVIQKGVDQQTHPLGGRHDELQTLGALRIDLQATAELDKLRVSGDRSQRFPKIMRGRVGEMLEFGIRTFQQFGMPRDFRGSLLLQEFGAASLGNIAKYQYRAGDPPIRGTDGSGTVVNRNAAASFSGERGAIGKAGDSSCTQGRTDGAPGSRAGLVVGEVENLFQGFTHRLVLRPSGQGLGDRIQRDDPSGSVGDNDTVANAGDCRLQQIARFFGLLFALLKIFDQQLTLARSPPDGDRGKYQKRKNCRAAKQAGNPRLIGAGAHFLPLLSQALVAGRLDFSANCPNLLHSRLSAIATDYGQSRVEPLASAKLDGLGQFVHFALHQGFQPIDALDLTRLAATGFRVRDSIQVGGYFDEGLPVWLQVTVASGQKKSSLPRFGILQGR